MQGLLRCLPVDYQLSANIANDSWQRLFPIQGPIANHCILLNENRCNLYTSVIMQLQNQQNVINKMSQHWIANNNNNNMVMQMLAHDGKDVRRERRELISVW